MCHSAGANSTGEVSSANYEARRFGIGAGMMMGRAKELCPALVVVPYEFEKYEVVSEAVYRAMLRHSACVQPLSCDEAFMDVTGEGAAAGWVPGQSSRPLEWAVDALACEHELLDPSL